MRPKAKAGQEPLEQIPVPPGGEPRRITRFLGPEEEHWGQVLALAILVGLLAGTWGLFLRRGVHAIFEFLAKFRGETWAPILPALGAAGGVLLVSYLFREGPGHGVPDVIRAVCRRGGQMRIRSMFSRWSGSMVAVGSGASAGLEGPIVFSGAAIGSSIGGLCRLDERRRALLLACGVAAGIAGVFNAPITGMIFAMEVVLAEWSAFSIVPIVLSAVAGTELSRYLAAEFFNVEAAFPPATFAMGTLDLFACSILGVLAGLTSTALTRLIDFGHRLVNRLPHHRWLAPALAGLLVGMLGRLLPETIGEGYDSVGLALQSQLPAGLWICVAWVFGKLLTTSLTLGSGTPGGIFAPSLVLGALLGVAFARLLHAFLPGAPFSTEGSFAIVGMAGLIAGVMQAPLTGTLLVMEITESYTVILPLMIVSVISLLVSRGFDRYSIYTRELAASGDLLRLGTDRRILAEVSLAEILDEEVLPIPEDMNLADFVRAARQSHRNHFPVLRRGSEEYLGMLELSFVREILLDPELARVTLVSTMMETHVPTLPLQASLSEALATFESTGRWVLPVVDGKRFAGLASKAKIFDHYRRELSVQTAS